MKLTYCLFISGSFERIFFNSQLKGTWILCTVWKLDSMLYFKGIIKLWNMLRYLYGLIEVRCMIIFDLIIHIEFFSSGFKKFTWMYQQGRTKLSKDDRHCYIHTTLALTKKKSSFVHTYTFDTFSRELLWLYARTQS